MTILSLTVRERRAGDPASSEGSEPGQSMTVAVIGELDIATVPRFIARMGELARSGHFREIVIDLSGLTFIDAGGLRALVELRSRLEQQHAELVLDGVPPQMGRLLRIIGPARHFCFR
ncbi:MAG TPA: STAS domain-containing protein [Trebonia sp.]